MIVLYGTDMAIDSYFFFTQEDNPDVLCGIEEYQEKDDLYEKHMKSNEFQTFAKSLNEEKLLNGDLALDNYSPASGFLVRPGHETNSGKFVWIAKLTCKDKAARDKGLELSKTLAKYVYDNEPKTLSFLFLKSLDDEKVISVFEMYENKEALTGIHHKSDAFKQLMGDLKDLVTEKVTTGYNTIDRGYLAKGGKGLSYRN